MSGEQAETYLRLLAESELRRVTALPAGSYWHTPRLLVAAQALCAAGVIDAEAAWQIRTEASFALAARQLTGAGLLPPARGRPVRLMLAEPPPAGSRAFASSGRGAGAAASSPVPCRVVPVGRAIPANDPRGDLTLLAYLHGPAGARFTIAVAMTGSPGMSRAGPGTASSPQPGMPSPPQPGTPSPPPPGMPSSPQPGTLSPPKPGPGRPARPLFGPLTATDDRGTSYQLGRTIGPGISGTLQLVPDPPHPIRWLELVTAPGEPAVHIDLDPPAPPGSPPEITVTRTTTSPGEVILDAIAARILTTLPASRPDGPGPPSTASVGLRAYIGSKPGDITAAMLAAGALSPASPVPGQLAALCERLGIHGHGITAPPAASLPQRWHDVLTHGEPQQAVAPGGWAAVTELPELGGTRLTILGLHHSQRGTILNLLASGVTPEEDWDFSRGVRPLPALWVRDSSGRWHATHANGIIPWAATARVMLWLKIVPPLQADTAWIDLIAAAPAAQARVRLPLRGAG